MIYAPNDYTGCRVLLYNMEKGKTIAEGKIAKFERATRTISISRAVFHDAPQERVSILIFFENTLHEYQGTLRKNGIEAKNYFFALYQGKEREERTSVRYQVNAPAVVENYLIAGKQVPLHKAVEVQVANISTQGCLIRGNSTYFNVGATFQMRMNMGDSEVLLTTTVLRINSIDAANAEYGCKF